MNHSLKNFCSGYIGIYDVQKTPSPPWFDTDRAGLAAVHWLFGSSSMAEGFSRSSIDWPANQLMAGFANETIFNSHRALPREMVL
ncbi:MAG TPA: hypothetical protein VIZ63_21100 [Povalibacter sp.]